MDHFRIFIISFFLVLAAAPAVGAEPGGERTINIIQHDVKQIPLWKILWDQARGFANDKNYADAIAAYQKLFFNKDNIELAQFEYGKVLEQAGKCNEAVKVLESLVYKQPEKLQYYSPLANCLDNLDQYAKAAKYYGVLFNKDPYGPTAIPALEGLVKNLQAKKNQESLTPLLKQLVLRKPEDASALRNLAQHLFINDQQEQAEKIYLELFNKFRVDDVVLLEIEAVLNEEKYSDTIMEIRREYLKRHPEYTPFRKRMVEELLKNGQREEALSHLILLEEQGYPIEEHILLTMADIYLNLKKRPDKALHYYEQYEILNPDNTRVNELIKSTQKQLAEDFLILIQNDGANLLWDDLNRLTNDRKTVFLLMAGMLKKQGDNENYLKVLFILHSTYGDDQEILMDIAKELYRNKDFNGTLSFLEKADQKTKNGTIYYQLLLDTLIARGEKERAAAVCQEYLNDNPEILPVHQIYYELAVETESFDEARQQFEYLLQKKVIKNSSFSHHLLLLNALKDAGRFEDSLQYARKLDELYESQIVKISLEIFQAELVAERRDSFMAEQAFRRLILEYPDMAEPYIGLIRFLLKQREYGQADIWLEYVEILFSEKSEAEKNYSHTGQLDELYIEKNLEIGNYRKAISGLKKNIEQERNTLSSFSLLQKRKKMVRLLFLKGDYKACLDTLMGILKKYPDDSFSITVAQYLKGKQLFPDQNYAGVDLDRNISFEKKIKFYTLLGLDHELINMYEKFEAPEVSHLSMYKMAGVYESVYQYSKAFKLYRELHKQHPESSFLESKKLQLEYKKGNFQTVLNELNSKKTALQNRDEQIQAGVLRARSLWALGKMEQSITEYEKLLQSSVYKDFEERVRKEEKAVSQLTTDRSFWDVVTFNDPDAYKRLDVFLSPEFLINNPANPVTKISNQLFSQYKWEKLIEKELNARKALKDRDYFYAETQFEELVKEEKENVSEEKLLDLAQIYNRLGKYSQEAELYEDLSEKQSTPFDLKVRIEKNRSVLKPNMQLNYSYLSEDGRDSYKDIKAHSYGLSGWLSPQNQQKFELAYDYNLFSDHSTSRELQAHQITGHYKVDFSDEYSIMVGLGSFQRESYDDTVLYDITVEAQLDRYLRGYVKINQGVVTDTIESVEKDIIQRDYELGFMIDAIPKVIIGGEGTYRQFSEDNDQQIVHLFSSYNVFRESYLFKVQYDFNSINSQVENQFLYDETDLNYWSPGQYWQHGVTFHFDLLLSDNQSFGGAPGHVSVEYGIGYEENEYVTHDGEINIFLEMSDNILLKGNISIFDTENFENQKGMLSLIYRW